MKILFNNKMFNNIIPIGDHCAISMILKDLNLREKSYPFDWISIHEDQINNSNFSFIIDFLELIKTKSDNELILNNFFGDFIPKIKIINSLNDIMFPHDVGLIEDIREKYKRRFNRLYSDIYFTNNNNLFIFCTRKYNIKNKDIDKLLDLLKNTNYHILIISGSDKNNYLLNYDINLTYEYIYFDESKGFQYDYSDFRPNIKKYIENNFTKT